MNTVILVGFMGSGKSTVGRLLAQEIGAPFLDVDETIERDQGRSVDEIFEQDGEPHWRALERDASLAAIKNPGMVVSLGGGALEDPNVCAAAEWGTVVYLRTSFAEVLKRTKGGLGRPMLARSDPKALFDQRLEHYERLADHTVDTDGRDPSEIVASLIEQLELTTKGSRRVVRVFVGGGYDVIVGNGISAEVIGEITTARSPEAVAIITEEPLWAIGEAISEAAEAAGARTTLLTVPSGEATKSMDSVTVIAEELAHAGLHRWDLIIAVGGGMLLDLAGFVASIFGRGIAHVNVPTTLLAQVDAGVGGKTGVNLKAGKNLVGAFHQPVGVICDVGHLVTLRQEDLRSGLAEVIKYGLIDDPSLLATVAEKRDALFGMDPEATTEIVQACVKIKARYVNEDERDHGIREHLNYGHTFGHAMEHQSAGGLRHGEAISLGMMAAAYASRLIGLLDQAGVEAHRGALDGVGLPTTGAFEFDALEHFWSQDKKYRNGTRFILLEGLGKVRAGVQLERATLQEALRMLAG